MIAGYIPKKLVDDAVQEIAEMINIESIRDSSGDTAGYISDYDRGLADALAIITKHTEGKQ